MEKEGAGARLLRPCEGLSCDLSRSFPGGAGLGRPLHGFRSVVSLALTARAPAKTKSRAHGEGKTGIADGRDVLIVQKVFGLGVEVHPIAKLKAAAEIELGVAEIEVAIGEEEAVSSIYVIEGEEVGIV